MPDSLIHYHCIRHAGSGADDLITVHEGRWAFCFGGVGARDHEWSDTGGVTILDLTARAKRPVARGATSPARTNGSPRRPAPRP
ncbi:MAG TPA: hypothetical protein VFM93_12105 [Candidatus Limnocylindria bacterium]|nr:hypothetical protein [Candidatus Limnocylindria bacterium]